MKPGVSGGEFATSGDGARFPLVSGADFNQDDAIGHGTHTAGSAAGATLHDPATTVDCTGTKMLGCGGGCFSDEAGDTSYSLSDFDDVVDDDFTVNGTPPLSINKLCPMFGCEGGNDDQCLSDDVGETLAEHGGMAQGAKLSIFDMFFGDYSYADLAGNGVWESCMDAGCKLHSNSYGVDSRCELSALDLMYDDFMYKVKVHDRCVLFYVCLYPRKIRLFRDAAAAIPRSHDRCVRVLCFPSSERVPSVMML